jgi:hypothetical protein
MSHTYRKFGRAIRYENGTFVRVEEAGEALEDNDVFSCRPIAERVELPDIDAGEVERVVGDLRAMIAAPLAIERLVVSSGIVEHQFAGRTWREATRRIHLSIAFKSVRTLVDLGDFDVAEVRGIASALVLCGEERTAPQRIVLAPNVAAALLPSLIAVAPPNVRMFQTGGGVDGLGLPVHELELKTKSYPNVYRPSYRVRPLRMPLNVRAECSVTTIDAGLPRAVALLAPPDGPLLRVLCVAPADVYPATVRLARIDAIAAATRWYPYGAGSFGSEMML